MQRAAVSGAGEVLGAISYIIHHTCLFLFDFFFNSLLISDLWVVILLTCWRMCFVQQLF